MRWRSDRYLAPWREMQDNLELYVLDAVQAYSWCQDGVTRFKPALAVSSVTTYLSHINKWYATDMGLPMGVTQGPRIKAVVKHLKSGLSLPNCQKDGIPVQLLRQLVGAVRRVHGMGSAQEAAYALAWVALLRPGEFTVASSQFDVTRHPCVANVFFYRRGVLVTPCGTGGLPDKMVFVLKHSKRDQDRLTQDVVVGCTDDDMVCPVLAMWRYLGARGVVDSRSALFVVNGRPWAYRNMMADLRTMLLDVGVPDVSVYGGHSFRVGGAQALAMAGKLVTYIMAYGRWNCVDSVMRYVKAPDFVRLTDAMDMLAAGSRHQAKLRESLDSLFVSSVQSTMAPLASAMVAQRSRWVRERP